MIEFAVQIGVFREDDEHQKRFMDMVHKKYGPGLYEEIDGRRRGNVAVLRKSDEPREGVTFSIYNRREEGAGIMKVGGGVKYEIPTG